jgi:hypothetical protein
VRIADSWVAFGRAVALADWLDAAGRTGGWRRTREEVRDAIGHLGWSEG